MGKMGRPTESKKDLSIKLRIDEDINKKLDFCMEIEKKNKSEIIREAILKKYNEVRNGDLKCDL